MKQLAILTCIAALFTACKSTQAEYVNTDGTRIKFSDRRLFTSTGASYESTVSTNGTRTIKATVQSSPQAETLGAVAEGVARGLKP